MAKSKSDPVTDPAAQPPASSGPVAGGEGSAAAPAPDHESDRELAIRAIRCMYGCGHGDAVRRINGYDPATITDMAAQERVGRRDRIPAILARAQRVAPKPQTEATKPKPER